MGRKFIVEEVEEKSESGCGSIIVGAIIFVVIGVFSGFKSCKEDKKPKAVEIRTELPQQMNVIEVQSQSSVSKSPHSNFSTPVSTMAPESQKEIEVKSVPEISIDRDIETKELITPTATEQDNFIITNSDSNSETPTLTEKERRKIERQAKREARRKEKAQKNN